MDEFIGLKDFIVLRYVKEFSEIEGMLLVGVWEEIVIFSDEIGSLDENVLLVIVWWKIYIRNEL